jgi:histidine triad (HIT) family protein
MIRRDITPDIVYENDDVLAFRDINPQAPTHILVIPKKHIVSLNDLQDDDAPLLGKLYLAAQHIASDEGIATAGYRTLINCGVDGGQSVFHVHLHLLGGRRMTWPPG